MGGRLCSTKKMGWSLVPQTMQWAYLNNLRADRELKPVRLRTRWAVAGLAYGEPAGSGAFPARWGAHL